MYEPYGFQENNAYFSKKDQIESELAFSRDADSKEFTSVEYNKTLQTFLFKNIHGKVVGQMDLKNIIANELLSIESTYDKTKKAIVLVFKSGQTVEISVKDLIDISEAGDGLTNDGTKFMVKINPESEKSDVDGKPYLTVDQDGVNIEGINKIVEVERDRAKGKEADLYGMILEEEGRASSVEQILKQLIQSEEDRANDREDNINDTIGSGFTTDKSQTVTAKYDELKNYVDKKDHELFEYVEATFHTLEASHTKLNAAISENQAAVANLQSAVTALGIETFKAQITALSNQIATLNSTISAQNNTINSQSSKISELEGRIRQIENWI